MPPSPRDREIIEIAKREMSCAHVSQFAPITRGPVFAVLGLSVMGLLAGVYLVSGKLKSLLGRRS